MKKEFARVFHHFKKLHKSIISENFSLGCQSLNTYIKYFKKLAEVIFSSIAVSLTPWMNYTYIIGNKKGKILRSSP